MRKGQSAVDGAIEQMLFSDGAVNLKLLGGQPLSQPRMQMSDNPGGL